MTNKIKDFEVWMEKHEHWPPHTQKGDEMQTVTITRENSFNGYQSLRPFKWLYYSDALASDGLTKIGGHDSIKWITDIIKRNYPKCTIIKSWA